MHDTSTTAEVKREPRRCWLLDYDPVSPELGSVAHRTPDAAVKAASRMGGKCVVIEMVEVTN